MLPESSMPAPVPEGNRWKWSKNIVLPAHEEIVLALHRLGACEHPMEFQSDRYLRHPCRDFATTGEAFPLASGQRPAGGDLQRASLDRPDEDADRDRDWAGARHRTRMGTNCGPSSDSGGARSAKAKAGFLSEDPPNTLHIALDNVEALGLFVEIEVMVHDRSRLEEAQAQIASLASKLHLTEVEPRSYLRQLLPSGM